MNRKEEIKRIFKGQKGSFVPFGFWFHFQPFDTFNDGYERKGFLNLTVRNHIEYYRRVDAPIYKLMTEGFFTPPNLKETDVTDPRQLCAIDHADPDDRWFRMQVEFAARLAEEAGDRSVVIYTLFSPVSYLAYRHISSGKVIPDSDVARLIRNNPDELRHALEVISDDISLLADRLIKEGRADGIFLAVRNYEGVSREDYLKILAPGERRILDRAYESGGHDILHVCGSHGSNDFSTYADYPYDVINWSVSAENLTLKQGKELFPDKTVMGGFDNKASGLLVNGSEEEIRRFTERLMEETGEQRLMLGADCVLPMGFDQTRIKWVSEVACDSRC